MIPLNTFNQITAAIGLFTLMTWCSSGFKYSMDEPALNKAKLIADQAASHDQSTAWATKIRVVQSGITHNIFEIGERKFELFVHDMLLRAGVTPPLRAGEWPLRAKEWADPNYIIRDWKYLGTLPDLLNAEELKDGDILTKWSDNKDDTVNCGVLVGNRIIIAGDTKVYGVRYLFMHSAVRRYTGK